MRMHTCVNDRVVLRWEGACVARNASTSQTLDQLRSQYSWLGSVKGVSAAREDSTSRVRSVDGMIQVEVGIRLTQIQAGRELREYPGAVTMCFNYERDVIQAMEDAVGDKLASVGAQLEANPAIGQSPTLQAVSDAMAAGLNNRFLAISSTAALAYKTSELPRLKSALERVNVPHELLFG